MQATRMHAEGPCLSMIHARKENDRPCGVQDELDLKLLSLFSGCGPQLEPRSLTVNKRGLCMSFSHPFWSGTQYVSDRCGPLTEDAIAI